MAQGAGLTVTSQGRRSESRADSVSGEDLRRLDRLAPLLHELLDWGLVQMTDSGAVELRADVQERLRQLTAARPRIEAQVYVGRPCRKCGQVAVTKMTDGVRMCSPCREALTADPGPTPDEESSAQSVGRSGRSRRHRKAG